MNDHEQLREQLWDLVYGLTSADQTASLHARIKSDPKAARLFAEVSLESELIAQAARLDAPVSLPDVAAKRDKPAAGRAKTAALPANSAGSRMALSLHWLGAIAASALAVLLAVGIFMRQEQPQAQRTQLVNLKVYTQADALVSGLAQQIELETRDGAGNPRAVPLTTQIADAAGQPRFQFEVETDSWGRASMPLPADALEPGVKLRVLHDDELLAEAPLPVREQPLDTHITLDRAWYQPGDVVRWRAVNLLAFTHQAKDAAKLSFRLHTPDAGTIAPQETSALAGTGIVTGEFRLPDDAQDGLYALTVQEPQDEPQTEAIVAVGREAAMLSPSKSYFRRSRVQAISGKPVELAMRDERKAAEGGFAASGLGGALTNAKGEPERLAARTEPPAPRPSDGPAASDAPAPPAPAAGATDTPPVESAADTFENAPRTAAGERLEQLDKSLRSDLPLPAEERLDGAAGVLGDGDTLTLAIPVETEGKKLSIETKYRGLVLSKIYVSPAKNEQIDVSGEPESTPRSAGSIQVPLPPVTGEVEVTLYDDSASMRQPLITQRVMRMPSNEFEVDLGSLKQSYAPGEKVQLKVAVKDEAGKQAIGEALLGVNVRPLLAVADTARKMELAQSVGEARGGLEMQVKELETLAPGLGEQGDRTEPKQKPNTRAAIGDQLDPGKSGDQPPDSAGAAPAARAPGGGGRVAPNSAAAKQPAEPATERDLASYQFFSSDSREAAEAAVATPSGPKLLLSNEMQVQRKLEKQASAKTRQRAKMARWKAHLGRWLLAGGVVMLLVMAVAFAVQRPASARIWIPSLGIAAISFAVGLTWVVNQPRTAHQVAQGVDSNAVAKVSDAEAVPPMSPAVGPPPAAEATQPEKVTEQLALDPPSAAAPALSPSTDGAIAERPPIETSAEPLDRKQPANQPAPQVGASPDESESRTNREQNSRVPAASKLAREAEEEKAVRMRSEVRLQSQRQANRTDDEVRAKERSGQPADPRSSADKRMAQGELDRVKKQDAASGKDGALAEKAAARDSSSDFSDAKALVPKDRRPHTVVWQPLLRTDENGVAVIEFTMPEVPGDYRLVLDVHGDGRVGQYLLPLRCEAPPAAATTAPAAGMP